MLNLEHVAVEVGHPLPTLNGELQIIYRVADERFDLAPKEAGVLVSNIGWVGITELRVAADLLKFVRAFSFRG